MSVSVTEIYICTETSGPALTTGAWFVIWLSAMVRISSALKPGGSVAFEFLGEISFIHRAPHPPIEGPRFLLRGDGRPRERIFSGAEKSGSENKHGANKRQTATGFYAVVRQ